MFIENKLYSDIESEIIRWNNDGTKTAGSLTRNIFKLLNENKINIDYKPSLLIWIEKMFNHAVKKEWYETYHAFDIHGVISKPDYRKNINSGNDTYNHIDYYPYAKETLQFLTKNRPDMILFIMSSSYPNELESYMKQFEQDNIYFKYVNENPDVTDIKGSFGYYEKKPYFNTYWEDKSGFNPETDWLPLYNYFVKSDYKPNIKWTMKIKEKYHKE